MFVCEWKRSRKERFHAGDRRDSHKEGSPWVVGGLGKQSTFYCKNSSIASLFFIEPVLGFSRKITSMILTCSQMNRPTNICRTMHLSFKFLTETLRNNFRWITKVNTRGKTLNKGLIERAK